MDAVEVGRLILKLIEIPTEIVYELIVSNECWLIARAMIEKAMIKLNEMADTLRNLGHIVGELCECPAEKPAERQSPIIGLSPAESVFPAHKRHERWHTAATGE